PILRGANVMDLKYYNEEPYDAKVSRTVLKTSQKRRLFDLVQQRAYNSISRFYDKCKKQVPGKKGYPKFKKFSRSVEYKTSGWKLSPDTKSINFLDKKGIGKLKLKGTWELWRYDSAKPTLREQTLIKRVRLVRRADGYYVQFCIKVDISKPLEPSHTNVGLDVGLKEFYTDSKGGVETNPRFYRKGEKLLKFYQRRVFRKKKGSVNRKKAINRLGRTHLKISRQREEHAKRLVRSYRKKSAAFMVGRLCIKGDRFCCKAALF
ncbi:transposase, partial [Moorena sp. SIO4G3]|uniref:RNA-guided endonuclease InsQ/TnpB family protein n=1 Tax=Moorena sp. SIO4G3 TaxID=2607821 RepID=UPI0025D5A0F8